MESRTLSPIPKLKDSDRSPPPNAGWDNMWIVGGWEERSNVHRDFGLPSVSEIFGLLIFGAIGVMEGGNNG